jgi:group I intron endonuclease
VRRLFRLEHLLITTVDQAKISLRLLTKNVLKSGVYCWLNLINGKRYVGSGSCTIMIRLDKYLKDFSKGECHNVHLKRAWLKYGAKAFQFIVLELCPSEDCRSREQWWMDRFQVANPEFGYNISPTAGSNLGTVRSQEAKDKASVSMKSAWERGVYEHIDHRTKMSGEETREKCRQAALSKSPTSEETLRRMSEAQKGRPKSQECKEKIRQTLKGRKPPQKAVDNARLVNLGKPCSEETRRKIGAKHKGKVITQEQREANRKALKELWATEEYREKIKESKRITAEKERLRKENIVKLVSPPPKKIIFSRKKVVE